MALAHSAASDLRQRLLTKVANQDFGYVIAKAKQFFATALTMAMALATVSQLKKLFNYGIFFDCLYYTAFQL